MKIIGLSLAATAALALVGCTMETKTVEQSTAPSAGGAPLSYPATNMAEYDAAAAQADDWCYKQHDLDRAIYVDRTFDTARFECTARR